VKLILSPESLADPFGKKERFLFCCDKEKSTVQLHRSYFLVSVFQREALYMKRLNIAGCRYRRRALIE